MNLSCEEMFGAGGRTRTPDLLITNQLLYQLSYTSIGLPADISTALFIIAGANLFVKDFFNMLDFLFDSR